MWGFIGSGDWYTCASKTRLARNAERAQRNPLFKPFLTPVSPSGNELLRKALLPLGIIIGVVRALVVIAVGLPYFLLDSILSTLLVSLSPSALPESRLILSCQVVPPIRIVKRLVATVFARMILFILGFWWIPVEVVNKRRGYAGLEYPLFHLPNPTAAVEIRWRKVGAQAPAISSSQTGSHGPSSYGSHSGTPYLPIHPTSFLTTVSPTQIRSHLCPPDYRARSTPLRHVLDPSRSKTRPPNRNRLGCNI